MRSRVRGGGFLFIRSRVLGGVSYLCDLGFMEGVSCLCDLGFVEGVSYLCDLGFMERVSCLYDLVGRGKPADIIFWHSEPAPTNLNVSLPLRGVPIQTIYFPYFPVLNPYAAGG